MQCHPVDSALDSCGVEYCQTECRVEAPQTKIKRWSCVAKDESSGLSFMQRLRFRDIDELCPEPQACHCHCTCKEYMYGTPAPPGFPPVINTNPYAPPPPPPKMLAPPVPPPVYGFIQRKAVLRHQGDALNDPDDRCPPTLPCNCYCRCRPPVSQCFLVCCIRIFFQRNKSTQLGTPQLLRRMNLRKTLDHSFNQISTKCNRVIDVAEFMKNSSFWS